MDSELNSSSYTAASKENTLPTIKGNPIFELGNVGKTYETGSGDFIALKDINMDVHSGEFLGIIGKSGAGKTTLLNMLSGVSEISTGELLFFPPTLEENGRPKGPLSIGFRRGLLRRAISARCQFKL